MLKMEIGKSSKKSFLHYFFTLLHCTLQEQISKLRTILNVVILIHPLYMLNAS